MNILALVPDLLWTTLRLLEYPLRQPGQLCGFSGVLAQLQHHADPFSARLTAPQPTFTASNLAPEVTTLAGTQDKLTVGTLNAENLDPNDSALKFAGLARIVVTSMRSPDILCVEEVQDNSGATNDGQVDADITLGLLINNIFAQGGPRYQFRQISPVNGTNGGEPVGNIRVAFLFNPERVTFVDRPGGTATSAVTVNSESPGRD
jgi:predicted extracellular nuclease